MTALANEIFPPGDPRDGYILRLDLIGSWESQFLGLGRLTAFLTPRLLSEAHAVDDMGVNVVFLQRHRLEVGLKLILERAQAKVVGSHSIDVLWERCTVACEAAGLSTAWRAFADDQKEYAYLLDRIDPGAALFRYPVDLRNQPWSRGLVDLNALERAGSAFQGAVEELRRSLTALETSPVTASEAQDAADELRALIDGCREIMRVSHEMTAQVRDQADALEALVDTGRRRRRNTIPDSVEELDAVAEVTNLLADRAEELLERIGATYGVAVPPPAPGRNIGTVPVVDPLSSTATKKATFDAQMKWYIDHFVAVVRPLATAVNAVYRRSQNWSTPAARQVHLEVTRFRSRLNVAKAEDTRPSN